MLENYLTHGAYRFQIQFGRSTFTDFYRATVDHAEILTERRQWLESNQDRYLVMTSEGAPLVQETIEMALLNDTLPKPASNPHTSGQQARFLGENWEPDYLLLTREVGAIRLVCGCVCFPSSWSVEEKIGLPIEAIHEVVPGLNAAIGRQIQTFLEKLKPGISWTRSNWGLSRSPERNQHPSRKIPRLDMEVKADEVYFRVEEQSLIALPRTNGILFGIRIKVVPLADFFGTNAGEKLWFALETMPEPMAQYKGLSAARGRIIRLLQESGK